MSLQLSVTLRTNRVGQIEPTVGTAPILEIRTSSPPANCAAADAGSVLVSITLPTDWLAAASAGSVSKAGAWSGPASGAGVAGHFRIKDSGGTTCHLQGTVSITAGGGDMILDNTNIAVGQTVTVSTFSVTDGNA